MRIPNIQVKTFCYIFYSKDLEMSEKMLYYAIYMVTSAGGSVVHSMSSRDEKIPRGLRGILYVRFARVRR